jgi:hypothetical protein
MLKNIEMFMDTDIGTGRDISRTYVQKFSGLFIAILYEDVKS